MQAPPNPFNLLSQEGSHTRTLSLSSLNSVSHKLSQELADSEKEVSFFPHQDAKDGDNHTEFVEDEENR